MSNQDNPYAGSSYQVTTQFGGTAPAAPPADVIKDTTTAGFPNDVIKESRNQPVLVDFWAPWCGPCKQLTPALEKAVRAAGGKVKLVKMNIDEHPSIAGQLGIQSIPAVIAFKNGQPVDGFMGAVPESQIADFIKRLGGGDGGKEAIAEAIAAAKDAQAAGDAEGATQIYEAVLQQAPDSVEAIAGLAELLFEAGDSEGARQVLDTAPEGKAAAPEITAIRTRMALAEEAASLGGDTAELEKQLAANPGDHQARFDLAMLQNSAGDRSAAADNLLAIVKADRTWNEDGARAQLLKFFEAWGPMDEATLAARRKLSSLLFS
ncbi:MAG TPA: thioredoxin [Mesorhizobium sp.]